MSADQFHPGRIFISYRRRDASGYARAVVSVLKSNVRPTQIFMDVDSLKRPGVNFVDLIKEEIERTEVFIALIGRGWVGTLDGGSRIDDAEDYVRAEVRTALQSDVLVIPVLIDGATMPVPGSLPVDIRHLTNINALQLSDTHFDADSSLLCEAVRQELIHRRRIERSEHGPPPESVVVGGRFGAFLLDALSCLIVLILSSATGFAVADETSPDSTDFEKTTRSTLTPEEDRMTNLCMGVGALLFAAYYIIAHAAFRGTIGKRICKVEVLRTSGSRLHPLLSILRSLCVIATASTGLWIITLIPLVSTRRHQAVHDLIFSTTVVRRGYR